MPRVTRVVSHKSCGHKSSMVYNTDIKKFTTRNLLMVVSKRLRCINKSREDNILRISLFHTVEYPGPTTKNILRLLIRAGIFHIL